MQQTLQENRINSVAYVAIGVSDCQLPEMTNSVNCLVALVRSLPSRLLIVDMNVNPSY